MLVFRIRQLAAQDDRDEPFLWEMHFFIFRKMHGLSEGRSYRILSRLLVHIFAPVLRIMQIRAGPCNHYDRVRVGESHFPFRVR